MKVRHKRDMEFAYPVVGEFEDYWICRHEEGPLSNGKPFLVSKANYEPVPTEKWVDVTGECDVRVQDGMPCIYHHDKDVTGCWGADSYRLRKVRYADCGKHGTSEYQYRDAFIVERKESV